VTNFKHECALVCRIHVSFGINQQLARLCVTILGSAMQSGVLPTRTFSEIRSKFQKHNSKQNQ
jgi:hypothetical protein